MAAYDKKYGIHFIKDMARQVEQHIHTPIGDLTVEAWLTREPLSFVNRTEGEYRTVALGERWCEQLFDCAWFHFTGKLTEAATDKKIVLLLDVSGEMLIVDSEGKAVRGLTTYNSEFDLSLGWPGKVVLPWLESAVGNEMIDVWADCAANDLFGKLPNSGKLMKACAAIQNSEMRALHYDLDVLVELCEKLPEETVRKAGIMSALNNAMRKMTAFKEENAAAARAILAPELARTGADVGFEISAVGHAHMDLAWLWPVRETIRKCGRTFSTVLRNMEKYPDYVFGASQPQQYQWVKDHYPEVYEQVKQRVAEGRWELQGGMWVEADINMAGAESLVRQVLYGKRFYEKEFGVDVRTLWIPDVFSYSPVLPQIMKQTGMEYFLNMRTIVLMYSKFPYNSFKWRGMDGSEVITHVMPEGTYNSSAAPRAILKTEHDFLNRGESSHALLLYGIGDGGGGPGEEHLERLSREKNLSGLAPVDQEQAVQFFDKLKKESDRLPTWSGELFVDIFQGTYTSQARVKYHMRKLEKMLRSAEQIFTSMWLKGRKYPMEQLERIWKETLLYQFHDILPGSSITRVNDEMVARSKILEQEIVTLCSDALSDNLNEKIFVNPHAWPVEHYISSDDSTNNTMKLSLAPMSATSVQSAISVQLPSDLKAQADSLENDIYALKFDAQGRIASIIDKRCGREVLKGAANTLNVYFDPGDAWRVPPEAYENCAGCFLPESTEYCVSGAKAIRITNYRFGSSTLTQRVELTAGCAHIAFFTHADWREDGKTLRTEFPVDVCGGRFMTEIQFGQIERPTHINHDHELGQYEVYAHKYADLSRYDYGVAILNDSKYGHSCLDGVMGLTLLRSPHFPDPIADRAEHDFAYALYPHSGDVRCGNVVREAALFNSPVLEMAGTPYNSIAWAESSDVVIETVKKAEDSNDIILRLYESYGGQTNTTLHLGFEALSAEIVNMLERNPQIIPMLDAQSLQLALKPFEIVTLRICPLHA